MRARSGFSLVELSIVLVILGLLTGGILSGQALIRAAELRSVSADTQRYTTAIHSFRDKYFALPGDMANAVRFWGAQAGGTADGRDAVCAALTHATPATGAATCNGNGNGMIGNDSLTYYEWFRTWQHLTNAGLIEGSYAGVSGNNATGTLAVRGWNVPASKLGNAMYALRYLNVTSLAFQSFIGNYNHILFLGAATSGEPVNPALRPEEAWNIDTKLDDGRPGYGSVMGLKSTSTNNPNCTTADTVDAAEWNLADSGIRCSLILKLGL